MGFGTCGIFEQLRLWRYCSYDSPESLLPAYTTYGCRVGLRSKFSPLALLVTPSLELEGGLYTYKISNKISCAFDPYLLYLTMIFQLFLVIAALFGVGLAALSCYGLGLAVGLPFGVTHQGLLFLLLGKKRRPLHK